MPLQADLTLTDGAESETGLPLLGPGGHLDPVLVLVLQERVKVGRLPHV